VERWGWAGPRMVGGVWRVGQRPWCGRRACGCWCSRGCCSCEPRPLLLLLFVSQPLAPLVARGLPGLLLQRRRRRWRLRLWLWLLVVVVVLVLLLEQVGLLLLLPWLGACIVRESVYVCVCVCVCVFSTVCACYVA